MQFIWEQISQWLSVIDVVSMRMVSIMIRKHTPSKLIMKVLKKNIVTLLQKIKVENPEEFISNLSLHGTWISGSFLLQCLLNKDWGTSHVNVYARNRETSQKDYDFCKTFIDDNYFESLKIMSVELPKNKSIFNYHNKAFKKISFDGKCLEIRCYDSIMTRSTRLEIFQHALPNVSFKPKLFLENIQQKIEKYKTRGFTIEFDDKVAKHKLNRFHYHDSFGVQCEGQGKYNNYYAEVFKDNKIFEREEYNLNHENEIEEDPHEDFKFDNKRLQKRCVIKTKREWRRKHGKNKFEIPFFVAMNVFGGAK